MTHQDLQVGFVLRSKPSNPLLMIVQICQSDGLGYSVDLYTSSSAI